MSLPTTPHPNADVRMRGFQQRSSVAQAQAWIDRQLPARSRLPTETVSVANCTGRVLAVDVTSHVEVPRFHRSMMDGYAVRSADLSAATAVHPLPLKEIGTCYPGQEFTGTVGAGEAVRIMTGAALPNGADTVIPVEQTQQIDGRPHALAGIEAGKHVGVPGEDIAVGDRLLCAGRRLRPQDGGVLSSIGMATIRVVRSPRVQILVTGNELLPMGSPAEGSRFADSNGPVLCGLVARDGGTVVGHAVVADDRAQLAAAMQADADVILVTGGSSVGEEDYAPILLAELGELAIHGVAMRPGGPTGLGRIGNRIVALLPGNPVSCLCGYDFFAGRAVRGLSGRGLDWPYTSTTGRLSDPLQSPAGRLDYARVRLADGQIEVLAIAGSSSLSSTLRADGFVVISPEQDDLPQGTELTVWEYESR
jgi:molybdopterin molybdotransferase